MLKNKIFQSIWVLASLLIFMRCTPSPVSFAGNTTQVGNGMNFSIKCTLFEPDGKIPAPNVQVTIKQLKTVNNALAKRQVDTLTGHTDSLGHFICDTFKNPGFYTMMAERGDSLYALVESFFISGRDSVVLVVDTIKPPGSLRCVVDFQGLEHRKAVFRLGGNDNTVLFDGLTVTIEASYFQYLNLDSASTITLDNVPEGMYTVWINISVSDQEKDICIKRTFVNVNSKQLTDLDTFRIDDAYKPFIGYPGIRWDSLNGTFNLMWSWSSWDTTQISGVNIYDYNRLSKTFLKINDLPVRDTFFVDSGFWNPPRRPRIYDYSIFDTTASHIDTTLMRTMCVGYYIVPVDNKGIEQHWRSVPSFGSVWWKKNDGNRFMHD